MSRERQSVLIFDTDSAAITVERRRRRTRKGKRTYNHQERLNQTDIWWEEYHMSSLLEQSALAWAEENSAAILEITGHWGAVIGTAIEGGNADRPIVEALADTRFKPITFVGIAEKVRSEIQRMRDQIGRIRGSWLGEYADHVIDLLKEARPNMDDETEALLKAKARGVKFF